ncbi:MAG: hypothetical protein RLZ12_822 [Bacillota bacterium]|jgi:hypothetical protein
MGLTVLTNKPSSVTILEAENITIFNSCCAKSETSDVSLCSYSIYYVTITITNRPVLDSNANHYLLLNILLKGNPIKLDCSPANIRIAPNNTTAFSISTVFDQLQLIYPRQQRTVTGSETINVIKAIYCLAIGVCPA